MDPGIIWPYWPKVGSNRAQITGAVIIPKSLIKVPGHIAILLKWIWELRKVCQNLDPHTSQLLPKILLEIQEKWEHP